MRGISFSRNLKTMKKTYFIETYGCQMNVADSEVVASIMQTADFEPADSVDDAQVIMLNSSLYTVRKLSLFIAFTCT